MGSNMKKCCTCQVEKSKELFYNRLSSKDGLSSRCRDCEVAYHRDYRKKNSDKLRRYGRVRVRKWRESFKGFVHTTYQDIKRRSTDVSIDAQYLIDLWGIQKGICALTGEHLTYLSGEGRILTNGSVDRIDPSRGYEDGNIRWVCLQANVMKYTLTDEELKLWCQKLLYHSS